jgi:hypothetical protein
MHDLRPEVHHLGCFRQRAEVPDVLVQCHFVVFGARQSWFQGLGLDMIADEFEVFLLLWGELYTALLATTTTRSLKSHQINLSRNTHIRRNSKLKLKPPPLSMALLHNRPPLQALHLRIETEPLHIRTNARLQGEIHPCATEISEPSTRRQRDTPDLPTDAVAGFEDCDAQPGLLGCVGGLEAAEAGADYDYVEHCETI